MYNYDMEIKQITKQELLAISLHRLYLTRKASMKEVVTNCLGLQAQFSMNPYYSLRIRSTDYDEEVIMKEYIKTWSFRGTMHFVGKHDIQQVVSAKGYDGFTTSWGMVAEEKHQWANLIIDEISEGNNLRSQLKDACIEEGISESHLNSVFHGWGGVLQELCIMGNIAYDASTAKRFVNLEPFEKTEKRIARANMIKEYFMNYGPATLTDCVYFTGYKLKEVRELLVEFNIELSKVIVEKQEYYYLGEILQDNSIPEIILLSGFDPLILGYKDKSRFMNESEKSKYVTNTGIIFPGVLVNGLLSARWQYSPKAIIVKPYRKLIKKYEREITKQLKVIFPKMNIVFEDIV